MIRYVNLIGRLSALIVAFTFGINSAMADQSKVGIFERVLAASGSFDSTCAALDKAIAASKLTLHTTTNLKYEDAVQKVRLYVLTSPTYMAAASGMPPNTISAQILRVAVYQYGPGKKVYIDMVNPDALAMVFYAHTDRYQDMLAAANAASQEIRDVVSQVPGTPEQKQLEPIRSESDLNGFDGDGPAKMMAMWRNFKESQDTVFSAKPADFNAVVEKVAATLRASKDTGFDNSAGWQLLTEIPVGPNAVYFGITNRYTENKCIRINSDFRSHGKAPDAPYPGVDHAPAFPMEVLVVNDGNKVRVLQYGEMWRMQLYFWDSGYLAFAKNTLIPSIIFGSIDKALKPTATASTQ